MFFILLWFITATTVQAVEFAQLQDRLQTLQQQFKSLQAALPAAAPIISEEEMVTIAPVTKPIVPTPPPPAPKPIIVLPKPLPAPSPTLGAGTIGQPLPAPTPAVQPPAPEIELMPTPLPPAPKPSGTIILPKPLPAPSPTLGAGTIGQPLPPATPAAPGKATVTTTPPYSPEEAAIIPAPSAETLRATLTTPQIQPAPTPTAPSLDLKSLIIAQQDNIIQLNVKPQGANANCGYYALKNGMGIGEALFNNNNTYLKRLQDDIYPAWFAEIKKIRGAQASTDWLEQSDIYALIDTFARNELFTITVIDDIGRLVLGEGVVERTLNGLIAAQEHMASKKNYVQAFVVGTMNEYGAHHGHWFTVVLWIHDSKIEFVVADSLNNRLFSQNPSLMRFINALTNTDFKTIKTITKDISQYLTIIRLAADIVQAKEYAQKDSANTGKLTLNHDLDELVTMIVKNSGYVLQKAEKAKITDTEGFKEISRFLKQTLNDLTAAQGAEIAIYPDTAQPETKFTDNVVISNDLKSIINSLTKEFDKYTP